MRSHNVEQSRELCCLVIDFLDRETDLTYRWCGRQLICCGGGNGDNDKVDSEYDGGVRPCCDGVGRSSVRLDVTHLIRCNSVCKSWKSLIASSHFIKARLIRSYISHRNNKEIGDRMIVIADLPACLSVSLKDFKHTLKHLKEELTLVDLGNHLHIEESLMMQDNDKPKGNNVAGPSVVNMLEHNNSSRYNDNKGKRKYHDNTKADPNKKSKVTCWKCGKPEHLKKDCKGIKDGNKANGSGTNGSVNGSTNSLKCQNMFNKSFQVYYVTYVSEAYYV
ncbi:zinc finger, CCHC-type containing protein [Tanacetum coccineum]|uniref:Zinc finger, CCHC-type containing protein n=1 Tax=Tanacetum coccineum TaxID=301880 RepID=A0ABQ5HPF0_9ASTR